MKKLFLVMAIAITVIFVTGCRENRRVSARNADGRINVTATIFPPYDFVRQIAGDRVNLTMLLSPGSESHAFEPSPRDIITIQNSDIFIHVGQERWVDRVFQTMNTDNMKIVAMMDMVEVIETGHDDHAHDHHHHHDHHEHGHHHHDHHHDEHHEHEHHHHEYHHHEHEHHHHDDGCDVHHYDEHVWTSPRNAILIVRYITNLLSEADPANAYYFQQNAAAYIIALEELDAAFQEVVNGASRRTIVFGDRFPFRYFAAAYGLEYFAAFPGCATQSDPSAATIAFLINKIRSEQIPVVFHIELSNERIADTISGETGARKLLLHSVHNVSRQDFDAGLGYLDLMRQNVENLRIALN